MSTRCARSVMARSVTRLVAALPPLLALVEDGRPRVEAARVVRVGALRELRSQGRRGRSRRVSCCDGAAPSSTATRSRDAPCCRSPCCGTSAAHRGPRAAWAAARRAASAHAASVAPPEQRAAARRSRARTGGLGGSTAAAGGSAGWSEQKKPWRHRMQVARPSAPPARAAPPSGSGMGAGPLGAGAGGFGGFSCVCLA